MAFKLGNLSGSKIYLGNTEVTKSYFGTNEVYSSLNLGPGSTTIIGGDLTTGFFGEVSQADFGITMTQVMSDLGITQGTAQFTTEPLLKFIHDGKVKFINKKTIRYSISWNHIQARLQANGGNVYSGATMTFGGNSYKVRLMRGWGQVTGDLENGPLLTVNFSGGDSGNQGVNWPTNTSPWSANNPNEWNTLMMPIHAESSTQTQTPNVPNWASFSDSDLRINGGSGRATWMQETYDRNTSGRVQRGLFGIANANIPFATSNSSNDGLRLIFELIP